MVNSVSLMVIVVWGLFISSLLHFGSLWFLRNWSISSKLSNTEKKAVYSFFFIILSMLADSVVSL